MRNLRLTCFVIAFTLSGCATVLHHDLQEVPVSSTPPGANVYLDCGRGAMNAGLTPMTLVLPRRDACFVTLRKSGWSDAVVRLHRTPSVAALGNVAAAGIVAAIASSSHIDVAGTNGTTTGGTVTASASGSTSMPAGTVGAIVLSAGVLVDIGTGAFWEQRPRRVDVTLQPTR
jgi:hypothetical protein